MENALPWLQVLVSVATSPLGLTELRGSPTATGQPPGTCHGQAGAESKDRGREMIRDLMAQRWEKHDRRKSCLRLAEITVRMTALLTSARG